MDNAVKLCWQKHDKPETPHGWSQALPKGNHWKLVSETCIIPNTTCYTREQLPETFICCIMFAWDMRCNFVFFFFLWIAHSLKLLFGCICLLSMYCRLNMHQRIELWMVPASQDMQNWVIQKADLALQQRLPKCTIIYIILLFGIIHHFLYTLKWKKSPIIGIEKAKYFSLFLSFTEAMTYTCTCLERFIKTWSSFKQRWLEKNSVKGYKMKI